MSLDPLPVDRREKQRVHGLYLRGNVWWISYQRNGRRYRCSLKTDNDMEADVKALELLNSPELALARELEVEVDAWVDERRELGRLAEAVEATYRRVVKVALREMGCAAVKDLSPQRLADWQRRRLQQVKAHSVLTDWARLSSFFGWLVEKRKLKVNPCRAVPRVQARIPGRVRWCERELMDRLIASAEEWDIKLALLLGFDAGLRVREIGWAQWDWFDFHAGVLTVPMTERFVPKGKRPRTVPMTSRLREHLLAKPAGERKGFVGRPEMRASKVAGYRWYAKPVLQKFFKAQGVAWVSPHVMRHTFASLRVQKGVSIFKVAKWLGISVLVAEKHYAKLAPVDGEIEL